MTEEEWRICNDPGTMLHHLRYRTTYRTRWHGWVQGQHWRTSERKLRLFACACCRRIAEWYGTKEGLVVIGMAEMYAVGQADFAAVERALALADGTERRAVDTLEVSLPALARPARQAFEALACLAQRDLDEVVTAAHLAGCVFRGGNLLAEQAAQADLLREIVGNPFTPARLDPLWFGFDGGIVVRIAGTIYADRLYADMPILADALLDAGCRDEAILDHCRSPNDHAPGCWVLDLLLNKQ